MIFYLTQPFWEQSGEYHLFLSDSVGLEVCEVHMVDDEVFWLLL